MSTARSCRYLLAAGAALIGIGMLIDGAVLTGIFFLITAVLLLPVLYQLLYIHSNEVQLLSPIVFLVVAIFSLAMHIAVPKPYTIPPEVVYSETVTPLSSVTTGSAAVPTAMPVTASQATALTATQTTTLTATQTTAFTTTQAVSNDGSAVYRTPSGKRYHYDAECGGDNSYEISLDEALSAGLTPCKKCAGG